MTKKIFVVLLFFTMLNNNVISMDCSLKKEDCSSEQKIDYNQFFKLCKNCYVDNNSELRRFLYLHPKINIDYQNEHGTTAVLYAAADGKWSTVWLLLESYKANKMISDKHGQTLFSKAAYFWSGSVFQKILRIYSLDELNILSKKMCFRNEHSQADNHNKKSNRDIINESLERTFSATPLHKACCDKNIPTIFKLLEEGANLDIPDKFGRTPYDYLKDNSGFYPKGLLFVAREIFNNGPSIPEMPMALICAVLEKNVDCDAGQLIKEMYVKEKLQETSFLSSAKACIWKPVCVDACAIAGLIKKDEKVDERHCLTKLMLMPRQELTKINKKLASEEVGL